MLIEADLNKLLGNSYSIQVCYVQPEIYCELRIYKPVL